MTINGKRALLSLVIFISILSAGQALQDWLGGWSMSIADVNNTAEYLAKAGSNPANNTTLRPTDGGIATLPTPGARREVYAIGTSTGTTAPAEVEAEEPSNFSGRWSLAVTESTTRTLDLALHQTGDLVFGKGVLGPASGSEAVGSSTGDRGIESMIDWLNQPPSGLSSASQAAASGTVVGDRLVLDLVSLDSVSLYRFDLALTGNLVSGSYSAYGTDGSNWSGTVSGSRRA